MPRKPRTWLDKLKDAMASKTAMEMLDTQNGRQMGEKLGIEERTTQNYLSGNREPKQLLIALVEKKYHDIRTATLKMQEHGPHDLPFWTVMDEDGYVSYAGLRKLEYRLKGVEQARWFELIITIKIAAQTNKLNFPYGAILHFCAVTMVLNILKQMKNKGEISKRLQLLFVTALFDGVLNPFNVSRMDMDPLFFSEDKDEEEWVRSEEQQMLETFDKNKMLTDLWSKTAPISYKEAIDEAGFMVFFEDPFKFCERPTDYEAYFQHAPEKVKRFWRGSFKG